MVLGLKARNVPELNTILLLKMYEATNDLFTSCFRMCKQVGLTGQTELNPMINKKLIILFQYPGSKRKIWGIIVTL